LFFRPGPPLPDGFGVLGTEKTSCDPVAPSQFIGSCLGRRLWCHLRVAAMTHWRRWALPVAVRAPDGPFKERRSNSLEAARPSCVRGGGSLRDGPLQSERAVSARAEYPR